MILQVSEKRTFISPELTYTTVPDELTDREMAQFNKTVSIRVDFCFKSSEYLTDFSCLGFRHKIHFANDTTSAAIQKMRVQPQPGLRERLLPVYCRFEQA